MENHLFCQANNWRNKVAYSLNSPLCFPLAKFRKFKNRWIDLFWTSLKEEAQGKARQNPWSLRPPGFLEFISWPSHPGQKKAAREDFKPCVSSLFRRRICFNQTRKDDSERGSLGLSPLSLENTGAVVSLTCQPGPWEAGQEALQAQGQPGLHTERPCLKNTNQTKAME